MKKKILLLIIALVLALTILAACSSYSATLDKINELLKVDYSEITIEVATTAKGYTLNGVYKFTFEGGQTTIDYSFDRLNELDVNNPNPDEFITRVTGRAVVQDGVIVEGGESLNLPATADFNGIKFKETFFDNYSIDKNEFNADVVNVKAFIGNNSVVCNDMHVRVLYNKDSLRKITLTYTSGNGANAEITYRFTK